MQNPFPFSWTRLAIFPQSKVSDRIPTAKVESEHSELLFLISSYTAVPTAMVYREREASPCYGSPPAPRSS
jgi:hypothetical protein